MDDVYPPGPTNVRADLTRPTAAYKRHAYLAVAGVLLFLAAYAALTGWFAWTAYRLLSSIPRANENEIVLSSANASEVKAMETINAIATLRSVSFRASRAFARFRSSSETAS